MFYIKVDGEERGPVNSKQLRALAQKGHLGPDDHVRKADGATWYPARKVKGLFPDGAAFPQRESAGTESPGDSAAPVKSPPPLPPSGRAVGRSRWAAVTERVRPLVSKWSIGGGVIVLLGAFLSLWLLDNETPAEAFEQIAAHAEAGEWGAVWDRIDSKSQTQIQTGLKQLARLAVAFSDDEDLARELESSTPRELFVRVAENRAELGERYTGRRVESVDIQGDRATLKVVQSRGGQVNHDTFEMLREDGVWKVRFNQLHQQSGTPEAPIASGGAGSAAPSESAPQSAAIPAAVEISEPDFRNVKWGMSPEQVIQQEQAEPESRVDDVFIYRDKVAGLDCSVLYWFANDQLVRAQYAVNEIYTDPDQYLVDRKQFLKLLQEKYGEPTQDDTIWIDTTYRDMPRFWAMAISTGDLSMWTQWETPKTEIYLFLTGKNYELDLGIECSSKRLGHLEREQKTQKALKDL